jgi:CDP-glycerol glycerophosphotransferase (TagB/SpsB family)
MLTDRYGFIAWNLFQIKHFAPLMRRVGNPIVLCPKERITADFDEHREVIEDALGASILLIEERTIKDFDGLLRGIFSQTSFASAAQFLTTPLFALQYSMAKEEHQYGPWHVNFNAAFCYGNYSTSRTSYFCPSFAVGHPRLSTQIDQQEFQRRAASMQRNLDPYKPTLLYAPTWGVGGSIEVFQEALAWLTNRFNVLVRPHHNTRAREVDRLQALPVTDEIAIEDDFPVQAFVSDLVISDFSGIIFDALFLGKPVLLLRNEEIVHRHLGNISADSIEVARAREIGPVASDAQTLKDLLERGIDQISEEYRALNSKLLDDCFVRTGDVPARILRVAEQFAEHQPPEVPQRLWLRNYIRRARRKGSKKSKIPKPLRRQAAGPVKALRKHLSLSLRRNRFAYVYYLKVIAPRRGPSYRSHAIASLINIGESHAASMLMKPDVESKRLVKDLFYRLWIKAPGNRLDLEKIREFEEDLAGFHLESTARLRRAVVNGDSEELARMVDSAIDNVESGDNKRITSGLNDLRKLRQIRLVLELVKKDLRLLERPKVLQLVGQEGDIQKRLGALVGWADQASEFDARGSSHQKLPDAVDLFLPTHFFAAWTAERMERRLKNWNLVRDIYQNLFIALTEHGDIAVQPRHQHFLNLVPTSTSRMSLSFFTKGGSKFNWHIKDIGIGSYISIDPDGYLSSSIFAKSPPAQLTRRIDSIQPRESIFSSWRSLFGRHGGDKYAQTIILDDYAPGDVDFFVPLQSTRGLEETFQPVDHLIRTMAEYAHRTGARVVFKRHPLCDDVLVTAALAEAGRIPSVSTSSADTWSLVQACSTLVTINSGVALQGIAAAKRVVVLGPSEVNCVAIRLSGYQELKSRLDQLSDTSVDLGLYAKFLDIFLNGYLVNADDRRAVMRRIADVNSIAHRSKSEDDSRELYLDYVVEKTLIPASPHVHSLRARESSCLGEPTQIRPRVSRFN